MDGKTAKLGSAKEIITFMVEYGGCFTEALADYLPVSKKAYLNAFYAMKKEGLIKKGKKVHGAPFGKGHSLVYGTKGFSPIYGIESPWKRKVQESQYGQIAESNYMPLFMMLCGYTVSGINLDYAANGFEKRAGRIVGGDESGSDDALAKLGLEEPKPKKPYSTEKGIKEYLLAGKDDAKMSYVPLKDYREAMSGKGGLEILESYINRTACFGVLAGRGKLRFVYRHYERAPRANPENELRMLNRNFEELFEGAETQMGGALFIGERPLEENDAAERWRATAREVFKEIEATTFKGIFDDETKRNRGLPPTMPVGR